MNCKRRYCFVLITVLIIVFVSVVYYRGSGGERPHSGGPIYPRDVIEESPPSAGDGFHRGRSYVDYGEQAEDQDMVGSAKRRRGWPENEHQVFHNRDCRMQNCFNYTLCRDGFRVYVYPIGDSVSSKYSEILQALQTSRYYTSDPSRACLFVLSIDTLDRDKLSTEYVHNIQTQINSLKWWRGGVNHVVFNLYSGTWPDYNENDLGFDIGKAMLAKSSISELYYRPEFDISFPLFHKEHSYRGGEPGFVVTNNVPPVRKYMLVFKGKRYLTGIGSETRNSLYHIHNGQDIILLTTCKHGKGWKNVEDQRCERDNQAYDKWDYKVLLKNSTFCLVPRGRRLGSYRFLESLQAGCIPVVLSNNWVLPFSEVIDWSRAAVWADERLLLQIPGVVRSVNHAVIMSLRQQTQFVWDTYFSSIEKIVGTTLEIIKDRIYQQMPRSSVVWNTIPGAMAVLPEYSQTLSDYPFYSHSLSTMPHNSFTAVIYATKRSVSPLSPLHRLIKHLNRVPSLHKIIILWHMEEPYPADSRWSSKMPLLHKQIKSIGERFNPFSEISTCAVFGVDEDVQITVDENSTSAEEDARFQHLFLNLSWLTPGRTSSHQQLVPTFPWIDNCLIVTKSLKVEFAFRIWQQFHDRIVGYPGRSHFWHESRRSWHYTSKWTSDYSMVLTNAAFYHRYYGFLYSNWLPASLHQVIDRLQNCEDILMNFLVSHVTKFPPIKVAQRKYYKESAMALDNSTADGSTMVWMGEKLSQRHFCVNRFADEFGYMPLQKSSMRFDPLLFKDPVSIVRKKYRLIDSVS